MTRVDSYTLKVEFNGSNRLPKGEDVYVFASAAIQDTTGNVITGVNTQQFKVNAPAAAPATLIAARAVQNSSVVVTFDKLMNATDVTKKELYTIVDSTGKVVANKGTDSQGHPTGTINATDNPQVTIGGLSLEPGNYTIKVKDIKDGNENKITAQKAFSVADTVDPEIRLVQFTDRTATPTVEHDTAYVYFSEAMDPTSLVNTENYLFNTGNGLVKLSENPKFISITPVDGNKGVRILFDASVTGATPAYKITKVKDIAGNEVSGTLDGNAVAVAAPIALAADAKNVKRVDGKTFTFEVDRHLSYVEKSDFKVGKSNASFATDAKTVESVKFENKFTTARGEYALVTVVAQDTFALTDNVRIANVATTPVSKDALGNAFTAGTAAGTGDKIEITATTPVAASPEIKNVYVTAANTVVVEFNKAVTGSAADFEVFDPSSTTPNAAIAGTTGTVTNSTTLTLTLGSPLTSNDATPTVKVKSLVNTQRF